LKVVIRWERREGNFGSGCRAAAARARYSAPVGKYVSYQNGAKNLFAPTARSASRATAARFIKTHGSLESTTHSSLIQRIDPRRAALPVAVFSMRIVVVVPSRTPDTIERIPQIVAFRRFHMTVAEQNVGPAIVTIRGTGRVAADGFDIRRIAIRVEVRRDVLRDRRHVANPDHFRGPLHGRIFDRALREIAIDIAAKAKLRPGNGFSSVLKRLRADGFRSRPDRDWFPDCPTQRALSAG